MTTPALTPLPKWFVDLSGFLERYVLAGMYFWLAWLGYGHVQDALFRWPASAGLWSLPAVAFVREASSMLIQVLIGCLLLASRPATVPPRSLVDVLLPLAVSTFFVLYSAVPMAPPDLRVSLLPREWQIPSAALAVCLGMVGAVIAAWGVAALGRSFGIFVAVRKVVVRGPYRYVRHPIYAGYVFIWVALVLANQSIAYLVLVTIHISLMVSRARLEESRLAASSEEYRAYMRQTGFLFPRLGTARP